jgi:hypothetical protein
MRVVDESRDGWVQSTYYVVIVKDDDINDDRIVALLHEALVFLNEEVIIIESNVYTNDGGTFCHSKFPFYKSTSGNYLLIRDWFEGPVVSLFEKVCKVLSQSVKLLLRNGEPWTFQRSRLIPFYSPDSEYDDASPVEVLETVEDSEKLLRAVTKLRYPFPKKTAEKLITIVKVPLELKVKSPFSSVFMYHGVMEKLAMYGLLDIGQYVIASEDSNNLSVATLVFYQSWTEGRKNHLEFAITYADETYNGFGTLKECIESLIGEDCYPKYRSIRKLIFRREALKRLVENKDAVAGWQVEVTDIVNDIIEFDNDIVMNGLARLLL